MSYLKIIWAVLVLCVVLVPLSRINIRIIYHRERTDDELVVMLSAFLGLINLKGRVDMVDLILSQNPRIKLKGQMNTAKRGRLFKETTRAIGYREAGELVLRARRLIKAYKTVIIYLKNKIVIKGIRWETEFGTGDAALTGFAIGLLWNIKTLLLYILNAHLKVKGAPEISIVPDFGRTGFSTHFDCILSLKTGHAIIAGLKGAAVKMKDGGKDERAPD